MLAAPNPLCRPTIRRRDPARMARYTTIFEKLSTGDWSERPSRDSSSRRPQNSLESSRLWRTRNRRLRSANEKAAARAKREHLFGLVAEEFIDGRCGSG